MQEASTVWLSFLAGGRGIPSHAGPKLAISKSGLSCQAKTMETSTLHLHIDSPDQFHFLNTTSYRHIVILHSLFSPLLLREKHILSLAAALFLCFVPSVCQRVSGAPSLTPPIVIFHMRLPTWAFSAYSYISTTVSTCLPCPSAAHPPRHRYQ